MKTPAGTFLTNAIVLTMDEAMAKYEHGGVIIDDDKITDVGPESELRNKYSPQKTIDCHGKVLMPGLINAHTHVPMTLLRGLADDRRLDVWLLGYMMPVEREFVSPDFVRLGTMLGCAELIRSGVTCFADMYYFESDVAQATADIGLRAICGQTVLKFPSPDAQSYEESLESARQFIQDWKKHPLIIPAVSPHAPYTCTQEILEATAALAVEFDIPLHTHLSETMLEVENIQKEFGMPVIPYVNEHHLFDAKVIAAHCVHIDDSEMHTLLENHAGIVHNPSSNLKLASGVAPVARMLKLGLNVGIGTDGPSSNNDLDMFDEIRLTAFLAKGVFNDPLSLPASTTLSMATRIGAQALHIGHLTGSLTPGKKADLILIDINRLHNSPRFIREPDGIYSQIVYASKSTDVTDVMVNGKWLMKNNQFTTIQEDTLLVNAMDYARRIDIFLISREKSVQSKLVAIGGVQEAESFEVQIKAPVTDIQSIISALSSPDIEIIRERHYYEYDTYFKFEDSTQGLLRYREDDFIDKDGNISNVRYRLTLIGPAREYQFPSSVLLSRSRYMASASHSLRFYREYFQPSNEFTIEKDRQRWLVRFQKTEFFINLDRVDAPELGTYIEIKSRTWSRNDAEAKSRLAAVLLNTLGISSETAIVQDYVEFVVHSE